MQIFFSLITRIFTVSVITAKDKYPVQCMVALTETTVFAAQEYINDSTTSSTNNYVFVCQSFFNL
jgi:hypothetical protein